MSIYGIDVPPPDELNYHYARQERRVANALKQLDPGDVLAVLDGHIAQEPDPTQHPP